MAIKIAEPGEGHNSGEVNAGQLRAFVERAERLNADKAAINEDLKELYADARGNGLDAKIIKKVIQIRAQDPDKRSEEETLIDLYLSALGSA